MSAPPRLRAGRILALGLRVWFRRFVPIHTVAAFCLAPLAFRGDPVENGSIAGVLGLFPAAWAAAFDLVGIPSGLFRNALIGYFAQFAVTVIVVRDAHRRFSGRTPLDRPLAILGLLLFAALGLALFLAVDAVAIAGGPDAGVALLMVGAIAIEAFVAATFWMAIPAAAVDGHRLFPALRRARLLSHGSRFPLAALLVLLLVLEWVLLIPLGFFGVGLSWAGTAPAVLCVTLKGCILAAAYREACVRKEGPDPEEIGAVFA